ncbi:DUF1127 domain-containing protein [Aquipseudomonas ullengensis]|uniref:DUF1127 domain-containing protein n=1 Tax=Aquipseudomonas ullengensis TaxID=2759166 RepID=A0A7W4QBN7_9GAMM|nr:DUF1127 domain-containing protein [Pseudomonas ullengensis]MBB2496665.1 DUF1127 domain-containing protein [Pseudomonas ullengensis]
MERTLTTSKPAEFTSRRIPAAWPLRVIASLLLWNQRARTRRQLAQLDDRQLGDIGISTAERMEEVSKPFWR